MVLVQDPTGASGSHTRSFRRASGLVLAESPDTIDQTVSRAGFWLLVSTIWGAGNAGAKQCGFWFSLQNDARDLKYGLLVDTQV